MKTKLLIGCLVLVLWYEVPLAEAQAPAQTDSGAAAAEKNPLPFPSGYGFPADPKTLEKMISERDQAGLRGHGWKLWAGINQPGADGWPIWRSWYIATQVFTGPGLGETPAAPAPGVGLKSLNVQRSTPPIDYPIPVYLIPKVIQEKYPKVLKGITTLKNVPSGENFQNNGDLMLVSEAFSTAGYKFIRGKKLYLKSELNTLLVDGQKDVPELPQRTIVLKHMYWPVKQDGLTALPVWDNPPPTGKYTGFEIQSQWKRAVAIDPNRSETGPDATASVRYLYDVKQPDGKQNLGPHTYPHAKVVSIHDFYFKKISRADYKALSLNDKILLDLSFYWVHQRPFEEGDYLVSMACHVITKEIPQWTLQSTWWYDKPDEGPYSKDRPALPQAKGPWKHYLMTADYGIPLKPGGKELPVVYNPYIELASHPIKTNCRNCHIRAAWPNGSYLKLPVPPNPNATAVISLDNPIYDKQMRVDFLWSIPGHAYPPTP